MRLRLSGGGARSSTMMLLPQPGVHGDGPAPKWQPGGGGGGEGGRRGDDEGGQRWRGGVGGRGGGGATIDAAGARHPNTTPDEYINTTKGNFQASVWQPSGRDEQVSISQSALRATGCWTNQERRRGASRLSSARFSGILPFYRFLKYFPGRACEREGRKEREGGRTECLAGRRGFSVGGTGWAGLGW